MNKNISIIVAIANNNAIGKDNDLLWHISEDLKHFKTLTTGKTIIMGRKTFESLPFKPLPNRTHIIISRNQTFDYPNCTTVESIEEAISHIKSEEEHFIIGGAEIYKQLLPYANKMYITKVYANFEADTYFPQFNENEWEITSEKKSRNQEFEYSFINYKRKN